MGRTALFATPFHTALLCAGLLALVIGCSPKDDAAADGKPAPERIAPAVDKVPADAKMVETILYNDANDFWRVVFLAGGDGTKPPVERLQGLKLARLSDVQLKKGIRPYLQTQPNGDTVAFIGTEFRVQMAHGVTEERLMPGTNERKNVVVRYKRVPWQPMMVSKTALGGDPNAPDPFAAPAYYYPPLFNERAMLGFGATGVDMKEARIAYARTFGSPPLAAELERTGFLEDLPDAGPAAPDAGVAVAPQPGQPGQQPGMKRGQPGQPGMRRGPGPGQPGMRRGPGQPGQPGRRGPQQGQQQGQKGVQQRGPQGQQQPGVRAPGPGGQQQPAPGAQQGKGKKGKGKKGKTTP